MLREHLSTLEEFTSSEPDGLHSKILKQQAEVISESPSHIFRRFWSTRKLLDAWKRIYVVSNFKKRGEKINSGKCKAISWTYSKYLGRFWISLLDRAQCSPSAWAEDWNRRPPRFLPALVFYYSVLLLVSSNATDSFPFPTSLKKSLCRKWFIWCPSCWRKHVVPLFSFCFPY